MTPETHEVLAQLSVPLLAPEAELVEMLRQKLFAALRTRFGDKLVPDSLVFDEPRVLTPVQGPAYRWFVARARCAGPEPLLEEP